MTRSLSWQLATVTQCPASVTGFRRFHSWQYPGWWTHVPSLLVKVGSRENRDEPEVLWESVAFLKEPGGISRIPRKVIMELV